MQVPAGCDAGALGEKHALVPVPDGDARSHPRRELRPQVVRVEAVVGNEHHGGVRAGQLQQALEHHFVGAVGAADHLLIDFEILVRDARHLRRVIVHEVVGNLIDGPVEYWCARSLVESCLVVRVAGASRLPHFKSGRDAQYCPLITQKEKSNHRSTGDTQMSKEGSLSSSTFFVCVHLSSFEEFISISQFLHVRGAPIAVENS
jgi:hypothetical protein